MKRIVQLLSLLLLCGPAAAGEQDDRCRTDKADALTLDAYDSHVATPKRREAIQYLTEIASLCPQSGYSLGQLYRHGDELTGSLVERDTGKAQELILASAQGGYLFAYADLAEMALKDGRAREAMQWTQVYLYFVTHHSASFDPARGSFTRSGYNGDLLARSMRAWHAARPRLRVEFIKQDLNDYLSKHEADVITHLKDTEARIRSAGTPNTRETKDLRVVRVKGDCDMDLGSVSSAYAMYLVEVQPSGAVTRVVLESFSPTIKVAERLRKCVQVYEFGSFRGTDPQVARIPVIYGYSDGASLRVRNRP